MKYYCIEYEACGFATVNPDNEILQELICPICYSPIITYPIGTKPLWNRTEENLLSALMSADTEDEDKEH